ncbi:MAG: DUF2079 domain-containing protein [Acidimicrobiales bacterium]|nr:DUF2079 domain-containing protein [Acidimicrobiales bacterium]RZV46211.1 MAG: DUF2079 domain-containing protein [Acidimicrobiales bacterium]
MTATQTSVFTPGSDLRRSVKHQYLRLQAQLEGTGPDRAIPWIVATILFLLFAGLALARLRSLELGEDFAAWLQGVWLIGEDLPPEVSVTGRSIYEGQFSIIMWPIAQVARVVPTAPFLLIIQSAALAVGVVPLWRIARRVLELGIETSLVLAIAYGLQPNLHNLNLSGFHPEALAVPTMVYAYLASQREQWVRFAMAVIVTLAVRSDLGLVMIGLGALLAVEGRTRAGRLTAGAGAVWGVLALLIFQADLAGGEFVHSEAFASYGDGPVSILWGMLGSPIDVIKDFLAEENFARLVSLFAPLLFLPILKPRFQLPLMLFGAFGFIASIPPGEFGSPQQDVAALAFLPVATAFAFRTLGRRSIHRVFVNGRLLTGVVFASLVFFTLSAGSSPYNSPWSWGSRDAEELNILAAVDLVGDDEAVAALDRSMPHLAERVDITLFRHDKPLHRPADREFAADVIILDEESPDWTPVARATFDQVAAALEFDKVAQFGDIGVYRR